jgi:hypothetical protein
MFIVLGEIPFLEDIMLFFLASIDFLISTIMRVDQYITLTFNILLYILILFDLANRGRRS